MNFNLSDLRAFVAVAELSSFRAAASELHLSQPALSRRIEKLEDALGVRLFDRTTRSVEMTAVGREFSRKARELLNGLEESLLGIRDVATRITGEVTVACVPSAVRYFLPAVLRQYHARYPRIVVRLIDEGANEVLNMVVRNEADFGLNYIGTQEPDVEFEPVLKEPFVVACPPDHPLARKRKVTWSELGQYDYMTVGKASGNRMLLDLALTDVPVRPQWYCEVRHVSTLVSLVEAGLGVAAVPRLAMPPGKHPTLKSVPLVEPTVTRTVGLIRRRGRSLSPAAAQLYEMLQKTSAERRRP
ncbi:MULTISPECIES: LysR family transcriptional regulator [Cupriavidus]|jgi:DNA-binding transcriptional LysR family regulator|uniref:LysR family transcriptional regulator n=1 Tax=Cupriavidus pauculus TaxID=82633 RepID=A0A5P2H211_9BURK|nr:LysR family transcriptional regulator [Cupriavidus pauculus]QET01595.1 LysR family transcriptional regulator [Cupriavidus pauculus]